jgi:hypothetical protein
MAMSDFHPAIQAALEGLDRADRTRFRLGLREFVAEARNWDALQGAAWREANRLLVYDYRDPVGEAWCRFVQALDIGRYAGRAIDELERFANGL